MSEKIKKWSNDPKSVSKIQSKRKYSVKLAAALRAGRSIVGMSQAAFALQMGISKSKLARAETATGAISSEDLEYALSFFRSVGISIEFAMDEDLRITVPDDGFDLIDFFMGQEAGMLEMARRKNADPDEDHNDESGDSEN